MSVAITINGVSYDQPNQGTPEPWGDDQAAIIVALAASTLQKSGGTFTLTAEVDFGATYGLKTQYYKTRSSNLADAGQFRLANSDKISWRNAANSGNLDLDVNGSDHLLFNGVQLDTGGDVAGPGSSTDNAIARFDSTTGKIIQNSSVTVDDSGNVTTSGKVSAVNIGAWTSFTPTGSWTTNTTYTGYYRRIGQNLEIRYNLALSGAPDAVDLTLTIPSSLHIDTTATLGTSVAIPLGSGTAYDSGTDIFPLIATYNSTTSVLIKDMIQSVVIPVRTSNVSSTVPFSFGSGDSIQVLLNVPILEYA